MPDWVTFAACLMAKEIHRRFLSRLLPEASAERNAGNLGTSALDGILEWDLLNAHEEGGGCLCQLLLTDILYITSDLYR